LPLDCRFVFLHLVYPYVASFSGLSFCFSSLCVPPMLPLDCRKNDNPEAT
jgi:hypothetical protein